MACLRREVDGFAPSYLTLRAGAHVSFELVERRSRFIAQLAHVGDEGGAAEFVESVRALHHDARHNVFAWTLANGQERESDDGEPRRTAGLPVLKALQAANLADVCCVVTRYFGGTLLGSGGLARAYSSATAQAYDTARELGTLAEMTLVTKVVARIPYALHDRVRDLAKRSGACVQSTDFAEEVTMCLAFRTGQERPFVDALRTLTGGGEPCHVGEPGFSEFRADASTEL